jgi:two-component system, OmpR family, alkaline phosphatase synthesis response regulator PhoP
MAKRVLICDDDEGILDVLQIVLEDKGYQVTALSNSNNIFSVIAKVRPNLVLLDLWMPGIGGEAIAKKLKGDPDTKSIPIVIISASRETHQVAADLGVEGCLQKPCDIAEIEATVEKYIAVTA